MQEKPKDQIAGKQHPQKNDGTWEEDQNKRGYYYDDGHGYQTYVEDENDEVEKEDEANVES